MTTWTYSTDEYKFVVTADDVHLAITMIVEKLQGIGLKPFLILPEDLKPLPVHHRYCRIL